jgi:hypothetical protein
VSPAPAVASFRDVPTSHPFFRFIEALKASGIAGDCQLSPPLYCPDQAVTRGQMAVFRPRGSAGERDPGRKHRRAAGAAYSGPPDLPNDHSNLQAIEAAARAIAVQLPPVAVRAPEDVDRAVTRLASQRAEALVVTGTIDDQLRKAAAAESAPTGHTDGGE